jgi:hypothetical protein
MVLHGPRDQPYVAATDAQTLKASGGSPAATCEENES